jgi:tetratricopeptide (TPR) repeat protein
MNLLLVAALCAVVCPAVPAAAAGHRVPQDKPAASKPPATSEDTAGAYYQFLLGRHLQSTGDMDGAVKALEAASRLAPSSAEILGELASIHAQQDHAREAIATATRALALQADNVTAHRVLGSIYAAFAFGQGAREAGGNALKDAATAIEHLEAVGRSSKAAPDPGVQLTLARLHLGTGAPDKAIAVLTRFQQSQPGVVEASALLAQAYSNVGRTEEAIKVLEEANREGGTFHAPLAELYERAERWREAAAAYQRAVEENPGNAAAKTSWAFVLINLGERPGLERARTLLGEVLLKTPTDTRARYLLSTVQRELGDLDGAEASARRLLADKRELPGYLALAQVFEQRREFRRVIETLEPVVTAATNGRASGEANDVTSLLLHMAFACQQLGEYDRALELFAQAKRRRPDDTSIDVDLVQVHLAAGRTEKAVSVARAARSAHPGDLRLARAEAEALRQHGDVAGGIAVLREALGGRPPEVADTLSLADLLAAGGRSDEAIRLLTDAQTRWPADLSIPFQLGAVYERQKEHAAAERTFREVIARDPLHAPALNYLGYMLTERGERVKEALDYIQRALKIDPENEAYIDSLGWAYFKMNRLDLAEPNLRKAAGRMPRNSSVQDHLGDVLSRLGRPAEAVAAWKRALDGDGDSIDHAAIEAKIRAAQRKTP